MDEENLQRWKTQLLVTFALGDLMLEEEKVMSVTRHRSVLQMRRDYGSTNRASASVLCYSSYHCPRGLFPLSPPLSEPKQLRLHGTALASARNEHPNVRYNFKNHIVSLDCLCLPHNYLHNAVQAQNAKLEQLEKTNKQLVAQNKQVLQLIQSMAKRRKLLVSLTMIRHSQASKSSRGRSVPA